MGLEPYFHRHLSNRQVKYYDCMFWKAITFSFKNISTHFMPLIGEHVKWYTVPHSSSSGKKQIRGIGLSCGDLCCEPGSFVDSYDVKKWESQPEQLSRIKYVTNISCKINPADVHGSLCVCVVGLCRTVLILLATSVAFFNFTGLPLQSLLDVAIFLNLQYALPF